MSLALMIVNLPFGSGSLSTMKICIDDWDGSARHTNLRSKADGWSEKDFQWLVQQLQEPRPSESRASSPRWRSRSEWEVSSAATCAIHTKALESKPHFPCSFETNRFLTLFVRSRANHAVQAVGMQFKEAQTCSVRIPPFQWNICPPFEGRKLISKHQGNMKSYELQHYTTNYASWQSGTSCRRWWCELLAGRTYCIQSRSSLVAGIAGGL